MEPAAEHQQQLRSLRDFLLVYNRMTELCFRHCVSNLNYRLLTGSEEKCLDSCAGKLVHANHRLMRAYVALMPSIMQRRVADYELFEALRKRDLSRDRLLSPSAKTSISPDLLLSDKDPMSSTESPEKSVQVPPGTDPSLEQKPLAGIRTLSKIPLAPAPSPC